MSGTIGSNIVRHSGTIAETAAGLSWTTAVVTGSTVTVEAGNGYFINTTSNACTVTLPSSAEAGDQIVLVDYARTWGTNAITIDSNGLTFQGEADTYTVEYTTDGQSINLIYSDSTKGWLPLEDDVAADEPSPPPTQKAIFAYGYVSGYVSMSNLVNSSGVIASDVTGVGTARAHLAGSSYGGDKGIFGFGEVSGGNTGVSNLVNNSGVIATDTSAVGTARAYLASASYGNDKAIFAYGTTGSYVSTKNLVSNSGVVASDASGAGTTRVRVSGVSYGSSGQAIFGYGYNGSSYISLTNLVSNVGVVANDTTGVGTARYSVGAASYGGDKAAFAYGFNGSRLSIKNLVSNLGVVSSDVTGVGTVRDQVAGVGYGGDKGIFAYGYNGSANVSMSNLMSNTGVIASDVTGVGTARQALAAAGYSTSA